MPRATSHFLCWAQVTTSDITDVVSAWDARFIDVTEEMLSSLILAASFMIIPDLEALCCVKVAASLTVRVIERTSAAFVLSLWRTAAVLLLVGSVVCSLVIFLLRWRAQEKTTAELRELFDIENDFTPEEETEILREDWTAPEK